MMMLTFLTVFAAIVLVIGGCLGALIIWAAEERR